ncbi:CLUMA_CG005842, isoform A [Clunio marinus]|uniref:CLUMA_CG005842, isoform A n=1 Tax=Clunio marinus TaxID=568069 RepID=A0A1J1HVS5_9DIPT|nr:CLUMA_CG005842, isoform A [Clunio marinus]
MLKVVCGEIQIEVEVKIEEKNFSSATVEIIRTFFVHESSNINIFAIYEKHSMNDILIGIISSTDSSTTFSITSSDDNIFHEAIDKKVAIIIVDTLTSFTKFQDTFLSCKKIAKNGFFLIIFPNATSQDLKKMFLLLWENFIYNVASLTIDENLIGMFTFFPFSQKLHCNNAFAVKINEYNGQHWMSEKFYPEKFKDLKACQIRVGTFETEPSVMRKVVNDNKTKVYGSEVDVLLGMSDLMNFTPIFHFYIKSSGDIYENGTSTGLMNKLMRKKEDVVIGFLSLMYSRAKFLSATTAFTYEPLAIVIPPGGYFTAFEKLYFPFSTFVWILLILMLIATIFVVLITRLCFNNLYAFLVGDNIKTPLLNFFLIVYGLAQHQLPKRNFARYLIMNLMLFFLIIRNYYQGVMFQFLQTELRRPDIASIDELIKEDFNFYVYKTLESRTKGHPFYNRRVVIEMNEIEKIRNKTLNPKFKGALFNYMTQVFYLNQLNYKEFSYRICKEKFLSNPMVFYFQKDFYLVNEFNDKMNDLKENGLINLWISKYVDKRFTNQKETLVGALPLNVHHLLAIFELWIGGLVISFIIFILEHSTVKHFKLFLSR